MTQFLSLFISELDCNQISSNLELHYIKQPTNGTCPLGKFCSSLQMRAGVPQHQQHTFPQPPHALTSHPRWHRLLAESPSYRGGAACSALHMHASAESHAAHGFTAPEGRNPDHHIPLPLQRRRSVNISDLPVFDCLGAGALSLKQLLQAPW